MNNDLISRKALRTDFQERLKNCDEWIANVANDHDLLTRALATRDFICEVLMTIDDAPTVEQPTDIVKAYHLGYAQATVDLERPKGHWRSVGFEKGYAFCICSNCGKTTRLYRDSKNEFCCIADIRNKVIACMYCGADMKGDKDNG